MAKKKIKREEDVVDKMPSKKVVGRENSQVLWAVIIIVVIFAAFLIPYAYFDAAKSFEFAGVDWRIEETEGGNAYYARFRALDGSDVNYNLYLWNDPRTNDVSFDGEFSEFWRKGLFSFTPETEACRGDFAGAVIGLGSFLKAGVGVNDLSYDGRTDAGTLDGNEIYAECPIFSDRTTIVIRMGDSSIVQNVNNPNCYTINIENCDDTLPFEKFIIETLKAFERENE